MWCIFAILNHFLIIVYCCRFFFIRKLPIYLLLYLLCCCCHTFLFKIYSYKITDFFIFHQIFKSHFLLYFQVEPSQSPPKLPYALSTACVQRVSGAWRRAGFNKGSDGRRTSKILRSVPRDNAPPDAKPLVGRNGRRCVIKVFFCSL